MECNTSFNNNITLFHNNTNGSAQNGVLTQSSYLNIWINKTLCTIPLLVMAVTWIHLNLSLHYTHTHHITHNIWQLIYLEVRQ